MPEGRRSFLSKLVGGSTVIGLGAVEAQTAKYVWSGWRDPSNQMVRFGFWVSRVPPDASGRTLLVSTTLGHVGRYTPNGVIDLSLTSSTQIVTLLSSEVEVEAAKAQALQRLVEYHA